MAKERLTYSNYLHVDKILSAQHPLSLQGECPAHTEMLFIIVHQAYELWFKQILHELDSVVDIFAADFVNERKISVAVSQINRITQIQKVLSEQIKVLETMSPVEFLEFRNDLGTASGFESFQYRLIENKLGLLPGNRLKREGKEYFECFTDEQQQILRKSELEPSLFRVIEKWLTRTPFVQFNDYNFVESYRSAINAWSTEESAKIKANSNLSAAEKTQNLSFLEKITQSYYLSLDRDEHNKRIQNGHKRLSYEATLAALFINVYCAEPMVHLPFKLLQAIVELDENFTTWRIQHALLAHRMLGRKMGSGHSSGYGYLMEAVERTRIFSDLFDVATVILPRNYIPPIPEELEGVLAFHHTIQMGQRMAGLSSSNL